jgi:hypothetical protein
MNSKFKDLQLTLDETARMPILHPDTRQPMKDDTGAEAYIEVLSTESQAYRDHERAVINARLARANPEKPTAETVAAEIGARFAVLVTSWHLVSPRTGKAMNLPCNPADVADLFSQPSWLRDQLDAFVSNRANFA